MIYDYICLHCGKMFLWEAPIGEKTKRGRHIGAKCASCGSGRVLKKIHKPEIIFRGSGFYSTDKDKK